MPPCADDEVNLYHDLASGVRDDRPGLDSCLRALRKGDVLVVWKVDRLGRNLAHLVNTVQDLSTRGVGLRVLAGQGAQIDTTAAGRLVFGIFAALAEFERELIRRRTVAGRPRDLLGVLKVTRCRRRERPRPVGEPHPHGRGGTSGSTPRPVEGRAGPGPAWRSSVRGPASSSAATPRATSTPAARPGCASRTDELVDGDRRPPRTRRHQPRLLLVPTPPTT